MIRRLPPFPLNALTVALSLCAATGSGSALAEDPALGTAANPLPLSPPAAAPDAQWPSPEIRSGVDSTAVITIPDSLRGTILMPVFTVAAPLVPAPLGVGVTTVDEAVVERLDPQSAADLVPLMPASLATTNSRGETVVQMRGAPERQVRVFRDGIPLNIPWDERVDLSTLPGAAIGDVEIIRGPGSALHVPNTLGGTIRVQSVRMGRAGWSGVIGGIGGESALGIVDARYNRRGGAWEVLAAINYRRRDGFLVWKDFVGLTNQNPDSRLRTNSDGDAGSGLVRVGRDLGARGQLGLSVQGFSMEKGVPPETTKGDDARFWRYPDLDRLLFGLDLELRPDSGRGFQLDGILSYDTAHTVIQPYTDASYTTPITNASGETERETGDDDTGFGRVESRWPVGPGVFAVAGSARYTRHGESLVEGTPEVHYSQWLNNLAVELRKDTGGGWGYRLGVGWDHESTPETGESPQRGSLDAPAINLRGSRALGGSWDSFLQLGRRSRFPSLRELYSTALGKFVANPDLKPEDQNSAELGIGYHDRRATAGATLFGYFTQDGIVKSKVEVSPGVNRSIRVNEDEVRTLGAEFTVLVRPTRGMRVEGHFTLLDVKAKEEGGGFQTPVENRPETITFLGFYQRWLWGGSVGVETIITGPREFFDDTVLDAEPRWYTLGTQMAWNLRLAYELAGSATSVFHSAELFVRVNNVFDASQFSQLGLPAAGRMFRAGVMGRFGG